MFHHAAGEIGAAIVIILARLIAYVIDDHNRYRRFLVLVLLALAVVAVRWLLADGGVHVILYEFGQASITHPRQRFG